MTCKGDQVKVSSSQQLRIQMHLKITATDKEQVNFSGLGAERWKMQYFSFLTAKTATIIISNGFMLYFFRSQVCK
jgi:hypothetical protein